MIGRARATKKGNTKVLINRRSFVKEWNATFDSEAELLRNKCVALGFNMTSLTTTVDHKSGSDGKTNSSKLSYFKD